MKKASRRQTVRAYTPLPVFPAGYTYAHGRVAYVKGRPPAPVILVHPNYAGCSAAYELHQLGGAQ